MNAKKINQNSENIRHVGHTSTPQTPQYADNEDDISQDGPIPEEGDGNLGMNTYV